MRTTITPKHRVLATLVKWTSLFLVLLAIMTNTISGALPIARTHFSKTTSVSSGLKASSQLCPDASPATTPTPVNGVCTYDPHGQPCAKGYTLQINACTALPTSIGDSSFCTTNPSAKYCKPDQPCANNSTAPDCTVSGYCNAHPDDTDSCGGSSLIQSTEGPPTKSPNGCPPGFHSVPSGLCQVDDGGPSQTIVPPCSQGYVNIKGVCYSNLPFNLPDVSIDVCTWNPQGEESESNEESGTAVYICPYTGVTLTCNITSPTEICKVSGSGALYTCEKLDASNNPGACKYYGPTATGPNGPVFASSKCGSRTCMITSCVDTSSGTVTFRDMSTCLGVGNENHIQVDITQKCSPQVGGAILTCHYDSTNRRSQKVETISITCSQPFPFISCTAKGPYNISLARACAPSDKRQDAAQCTITGSGSTLWIDQCESTSDVGAIPDCTIFDTSGNVQLGLMHCDSPSSCTITDDGGNQLTVTCTTSVCYTGKTDPDCPHTTEPAATPLTEALVACSGSLVVDMLEYLNAGGAAPSSYQLVYPLSQAELEFVLTDLGVGSNTWSHNNLPDVLYL